MIDLNAPDRVYSHFSKKPKFLAWLAVNNNIVKAMMFNIGEVSKMYYVDQSSGHMLDVLGAIVGIKRPILKLAIDEETDNQFGRYEFGGKDFHPSNPELYRPCDDNLYRILIKGKIFKNNSNATPDAIVTAIKFVTKTKAIVKEIEMAYIIEFQNQLSKAESFIINNYDILPRPQGVKFLRFEVKNALTEYGRNNFGIGSQFNTF